MTPVIFGLLLLAASEHERPLANRLGCNGLLCFSFH